MIIKLPISRLEVAEEVFKTKLASLIAFLSLAKNEGLFSYERLSIWKESLVESEGGVRITYEEDISKWTPTGIANYVSKAILEKGLVPITKALILIEGKIIGEYEGYMVLNNVPDLRRVYGDIEFDVYPQGNVEGLYDLMFSNEDFRRRLTMLVVNLISRIVRKPDIIVEGFSLDALWNMNERVLFYSSDRKAIVKDVFKTIRYLAEMKQDSELQELARFIRPYKEELLAKLMFNIRGFTERLLEMSKKAGINLMLKRSVTYIALRRESSREFMRMFINSIIIPLKERIKIDEEILRQTLESIITSTSKGTSILR